MKAVWTGMTGSGGQRGLQQQVARPDPQRLGSGHCIDTTEMSATTGNQRKLNARLEAYILRNRVVSAHRYVVDRGAAIAFSQRSHRVDSRRSLHAVGTPAIGHHLSAHYPRISRADMHLRPSKRTPTVMIHYRALDQSLGKALDADNAVVLII